MLLSEKKSIGRARARDIRQEINELERERHTRRDRLREVFKAIKKDGSTENEERKEEERGRRQTGSICNFRETHPV
jgi:hypothetical protein